MVIIKKDENDVLNEKVTVEMTIGELTLITLILGKAHESEDIKTIEQSSDLKDEFKSALEEMTCGESYEMFCGMADFLEKKGVFE